jgi:UDP-2,3-diacylglucosamine pyrophosphatase LpxH
MSDIRYICMSDLHFGQNDGLLTALNPSRDGVDYLNPSPTLRSLCENLRTLILQNSDGAKKPILVLNGDVMEIALATMNEAAMVFDQFVTCLLPADEPPILEKIVYIPGNHDHHFWEMARETQYVNYLETLKPKETLNPAWHATNLFVEERARTVTSFFLNRLVRRHSHLADFEVEIAYPNFGLSTSDQERAVVFHHGHYAEDIYCLMTNLANRAFPDERNQVENQPQDVWRLEEENFAWIDFFWSTMGRSGKIGSMVQKVYNSFGYKKARDEILENLVGSVIDDIDPLGPDYAWKKMTTPILSAIVDKAADMEKKKAGDKPLSDAGLEGLENYICQFVKRQILSEHEDRFPRDLRFVFGHTHKPFEEQLTYPTLKQQVAVYNTGGWVVESSEDNPLHGASMVCLDDDLNLAVVQLYKETDFTVKVSPGLTDEPNPLEDTLSSRIARQAGWRAFSETVQSSIKAHQAFLGERLGAEQG